MSTPLELTEEVCVDLVHGPDSESPSGRSWRPVVPAGIAWSTADGVPCDLDKASPRYGEPLFPVAFIRVRPQDVARVRPAAQIPEGALLTVRCVRALARQDQAAVETAFYQERDLGTSATAEGRERLGRTLRQLWLRKLDKGIVRRLERDLNLSAAARDLFSLPLPAQESTS